MAFVRVTVPRTSQPQDLCGIDRSNPFARSVRLAITPAATTHALTYGTNYQPTVGPAGLEFCVRDLGSRSSGAAVADPTNAGVSGDATVLVVFRRFGGATNFPTIFSEQVRSPEGVLYPRNMMAHFNGSWVWRTRDTFTGDAGTQRDLTVSAPVAGAMETRVFTVSQGVKQAYKNGRLDASTTVGAPFTDAQASRIDMATDAGGSHTNGDSRIALYVTFNRALSAQEVKSLSDNPWQIFEPEETLVWAPKVASAAPSGRTGSLIAVEVGSDTFAAIAGVQDAAVSGSLAAAETGPDTASVTASAAASGAVAATEQGADAPSISAKVAVSGQLTGVETGSDVFTASTSAPIAGSGTLQALEVGADIAVVTASARAQGALAAAEQGADTATVTAQTNALAVSQGALSAVEAGGDAARAFIAALVSGALAAIETGSDRFYARESEASVDPSRVLRVQADPRTLFVSEDPRTLFVSEDPRTLFVAAAQEGSM